MKFRPILFSTEMVKALLDGRKTQTRRVVKPQPTDDWMANTKKFSPGGSMFDHAGKQIYWLSNPSEKSGEIRCPYGRPGNVLWVCETWTKGYESDGGDQNGPLTTYYKADGIAQQMEWHDEESLDGIREKGPRWKPSIHMPKSACRIFLKIEDIRVERLQDISEGDALAEGVELLFPGNQMGYRSYVMPNGGSGVFPYVSFRTLWQKINGQESYETNPWVWAISFTRIDKPENF